MVSQAKILLVVSNVIYLTILDLRSVSAMGRSMKPGSVYMTRDCSATKLK